MWQVDQLAIEFPELQMKTLKQIGPMVQAAIADEGLDDDRLEIADSLFPDRADGGSRTTALPFLSRGKRVVDRSKLPDADTVPDEYVALYHLIKEPVVFATYKTKSKRGELYVSARRWTANESGGGHAVTMTSGGISLQSYMQSQDKDALGTDWARGVLVSDFRARCLEGCPAVAKVARAALQEVGKEIAEMKRASGEDDIGQEVDDSEH